MAETRFCTAYTWKEDVVLTFATIYRREDEARAYRVAFDTLIVPPEDLIEAGGQLRDPLELLTENRYKRRCVAAVNYDDRRADWDVRDKNRADVKALASYFASRNIACCVDHYHAEYTDNYPPIPIETQHNWTKCAKLFYEVHLEAAFRRADEVR